MKYHGVELNNMTFFLSFFNEVHKVEVHIYLFSQSNFGLWLPNTITSLLDNKIKHQISLKIKYKYIL